MALYSYVQKRLIGMAGVTEIGSTRVDGPNPGIILTGKYKGYTLEFSADVKSGNVFQLCARPNNALNAHGTIYRDSFAALVRAVDICDACDAANPNRNPDAGGAPIAPSADEPKPISPAIEAEARAIGFLYPAGMELYVETGTGKHRATSAGSRIEHDEGALVATVTDDGKPYPIVVVYSDLDCVKPYRPDPAPAPAKYPLTLAQVANGATIPACGRFVLRPVGASPNLLFQVWDTVTQTGDEGQTWHLAFRTWQAERREELNARSLPEMQAEAERLTNAYPIGTRLIPPIQAAGQLCVSRGGDILGDRVCLRLRLDRGGESLVPSDKVHTVKFIEPVLAAVMDDIAADLAEEAGSKDPVLARQAAEISDRFPVGAAVYVSYRHLGRPGVSGISAGGFTDDFENNAFLLVKDGKGENIIVQYRDIEHVSFPTATIDDAVSRMLELFPMGSRIVVDLGPAPRRAVATAVWYSGGFSPYGLHVKYEEGDEGNVGFSDLRHVYSEYDFAARKLDPDLQPSYIAGARCRAQGTKYDRVKGTTIGNDETRARWYAGFDAMNEEINDIARRHGVAVE